ncbi:MAG: capsular polysaccharide biosynthesis protein, partial [Prochlorococcaceae cyanobacterium]
MASPLPAARLGLPAAGMLRHRTLAALLADHRLVTGAARCAGAELEALLAWGRKPSARLAERLARRRRLALWRCEDAFLRSLDLGPDSAPLGLVLDDAGIYYDAERPCRLERLIAAPHTQAQLQRAEAIRRLWCEQRVSKYNGSREAPAPAEPFVLVVDQTAGDLSIGLGGATAASFETMLAAALAHHPGRLVVVKTHPDVVRGRKRGHFQARQLQHPRIRLEASGGHPAALLEQAAAVYAVTSQLGFEALLWERPVHCFGMPFYAGWGLTHDHGPAPGRRQPRQLGNLIHAALVDYAVYVDPHRHQRCALEDLITAIGLQRRLRGQMPERIEAFGFTPWKQRVLRRFLAGSRLRFKFQWQGAGHRAQALVVWGRRARPQRLEAASRRALP